MYKDRYEEFQATITKSNDMFQKLKSEMDKVWVSFLISRWINQYIFIATY